MWSFGCTDSSKEFTVKSCYNLLVNLYEGAAMVADLDLQLIKLWRTFCPSNVSIFGWRLLRNSLLTRSLLVDHHMIANATDVGCPICLLNEDIDHHFLFCSFAGDAWQQVYQ